MFLRSVLRSSARRLQSTPRQVQLVVNSNVNVSTNRMKSTLAIENEENDEKSNTGIPKNMSKQKMARYDWSDPFFLFSKQLTEEEKMIKGK